MSPVDSFDFEKWKRQFRSLATQDPKANQFIDELRSRGVDMEVWEALLALSCDFRDAPGWAALAWFREQGLTYAGRSLRLADRLANDRKALLELYAENDKPELFASLATTIDELRRDAESTDRLVSVRTLNPTFFLVMLIDNILEKTNRPHYREVSDLLEIAYTAHNQGPPARGEEALRKTIDRFRERGADLIEIRNVLEKNPIIVAILFVLLAIMTNKERPPEAFPAAPTGREPLF